MLEDFDPRADRARPSAIALIPLAILTACGGGGGGGASSARALPLQAPDVALSSAVASPASGVLADGRDVATLAVTLRDSTGSPIAGVAITVTSSGAGVTIDPAPVSDSDGRILTTARSIVATTATLDIEAAGRTLNDRPTLSFVAPQAPASLTLATTAAVTEGRFATAPVCASCHSNAAGANAMRDAAGNAIAPHDLWQATMMANAARDPFFRAMVAAEQEATPAAAGAIADKCLTCHSPMARTEAHLNNEPSPDLALISGPGSSPRTQLALDGVSCTLCHQIQDIGLGSESSFSGGFVIGDQREIFGPHASPFAMPMVGQSGFTPVAGGPLPASRHCASCHTLTTDTLDSAGIPTGHSLLEQAPYLEWRNSVFSTETPTPRPEAASCASCHAPTEDALGGAIRTAIARRPNGTDFPSLGPRSPYGRHLFLGGNTLIPGILRDRRAELQPTAGDAAFDALIARVRDQLATRTARIETVSAGRRAGRVEVRLRLRNLTGHKLPTGFPSRRVLLELTLRDRNGRILVRSGHTDSRGRLLDAAGRIRPEESRGGGVIGHRSIIDSADAALVYEAVMADASGAPTGRLLRGASFLKDNRLLPRGWTAVGPEAGRTAATGAAASDGDFTGGADEVLVSLPEGGAGAPFSLEARLLYQTLSPRFADELFQSRTTEARAFRAAWLQADTRPLTLAIATVPVP